VQDPPSLATIQALATAQGDGRVPSKFEMRMTAAALELVQRALAQAPESDRAERARLVVLLDEDGALDHLNRRLCQRIRAGALDLSSPELAAHLRATTMEKLAIDQPTYAAYQRALETVQG
jgi:hypothetical protein